MDNNDMIYKIIDVNNASLMSSISNLEKLISSKFDAIELRIKNLEEKEKGLLTTTQKNIIKYAVIVALALSVSIFSNKIPPSTKASIEKVLQLETQQLTE